VKKRIARKLKRMKQKKGEDCKEKKRRARGRKRITRKVQ